MSCVPARLKLKLGQKQELFTRLICTKLVPFALSKGYQIRGGEWWRSEAAAIEYARTGKGIKNSNHRKKLAWNINLFKNGKFLTSTEDHRELGEYWEKLHPLCRWGGRFKRRDANHYSLLHNGIA